MLSNLTKAGVQPRYHFYVLNYFTTLSPIFNTVLIASNKYPQIVSYSLDLRPLLVFFLLQLEIYYHLMLIFNMW